MHVRTMAEHLNVLPLEEAGDRLLRGDLPARAACITFDDGYENNLTVAAPILERYGLPATVFVAVEPLRCGIMFNDLVIETLRHANGELDLEPEGLGCLRFANEQEKIASIPQLLTKLKYQNRERRWANAVSMYKRTTGQDLPRLMLSPERIGELCQHGIRVGAHTMTHPILANLDARASRSEIVESRKWLTDMVGEAPLAFAYPNGRPGIDYTADHVRMVRDAGYKVAVSTTWGCATRHSAVLELPRFTPWETEPTGYLRRLQKTLLRSWLPSSKGD